MYFYRMEFYFSTFRIRLNISYKTIYFLFSIVFAVRAMSFELRADISNASQLLNIRGDISLKK